MNNVLYAFGPSFKQNLRVDTPSGNVDLAPTVLRILGITGGPHMDGRVLEEALAGGPDPASVAISTKVHQAEHRLVSKSYRQRIKISSVGETNYIDE